jgi:phage gp29-like protein
MMQQKYDPLIEILASDKLGSYLQYGYGQPFVGAPDDPTWVWENLWWNPWLAMAVYSDLAEKDSMIASALDTRLDGVMAKPRVVLPGGEKRQDAKLAEWVDETLQDFFAASIGDGGDYFGFDNFLREALDAVGRGVAIGEICFAEGRDRIYVSDVKFKPQQLFAFGDSALAGYSSDSYLYPQTGPLRLRQGVVWAEGVPLDGLLPERKFFVHTYRPRYNNRWGSPLLRKVFWPSWFKRAGVKTWLRYIEKGAGSVVARYNDGAPQDEQQTALDAARAVQEESVAALPKKFLIEAFEQVRPIGDAPQAFVDDFSNNEIARAILGQTLTSRGSEGGGSRALGDVHQEVRAEKIEADAKSLMLAVNTRLVWPLVLLNHGPVARPPVWAIQYDPGADLNSAINWLQRLWQMRVQIPKDYVYQTFQIPMPAEGEDIIEPPTQQQESKVSQRDAEAADFAEAQKKTLKSPTPSASKTARFRRLRPSMTGF